MSRIRANKPAALWPALFDDFFGWESLNRNNNPFPVTSATIPSINIRESTDSFDIELAAPGLQKEDFNVELDGNTLTISSEKEQNEESEEKGYSRKEFSYQSFCRSFVLPKDVTGDEKKIQARYDKGILHLHIPRQAPVKEGGTKKITVA